MCPSSRCPVRRPRLYRLSWKIPAVGHYTVERAKKSRYFGFPAVKKKSAAIYSLDQPGCLAQPTLRCHPPCPREVSPRTPTGYEPCDRRTLERWKKDSFTFPLCQYLWQNGLTNSETWRCPDADERERLLGARPDHSWPAMSTSAKKLGAGERSIASIRICGAHGVVRVFVRGLIPRPPSSSGSPTCSRACQSLLTACK